MRYSYVTSSPQVLSAAKEIAVKLDAKFGPADVAAVGKAGKAVPATEAARAAPATV